MQGCSRDFKTGGARPLSSKKSGGAQAQPAHTATPALFLNFTLKIFAFVSIRQSHPAKSY